VDARRGSFHHPERRTVRALWLQLPTKFRFASASTPRRISALTSIMPPDFGRVVGDFIGLRTQPVATGGSPDTLHYERVDPVAYPGAGRALGLAFLMGCRSATAAHTNETSYAVSSHGASYESLFPQQPASWKGGERGGHPHRPLSQREPAATRNVDPWL